MKIREKSQTFLQLPKLSSNTAVYSLAKTKKNVIQYPQKQYTAKSYAIYDENLYPIVQFSQDVRREIASLTKMMTLLLSLRICKKFNINIKNCYFRVSTNAANTIGTSAELQPMEWLTVEDLFHGLMLPSGNDAATTLAENFGAFLFYEKLGQQAILENVKSLDVTEDSWNLKMYLQQFVKNMNLLARQLQMRDTLFINPHGLDGNYRFQSFSTAKDIAILTKKIFQYQQCRAVINCKSYKAKIKITCGNSKEIDSRTEQWLNTNKLLDKQGYIGAKTGQTLNGGNCLASVYQHKSGKQYIIVVLGCLTKDGRFIQTHSLVQKYL